MKIFFIINIFIIKNLFFYNERAKERFVRAKGGQRGVTVAHAEIGGRWRDGGGVWGDVVARVRNRIDKGGVCLAFKKSNL